MKRRFVTLDVFNDRRFAGNPLAVVLQAEGLDDAGMQTIAGEFNLSETVFVLPPLRANNRASLRIFTPKRELPFAGHPTVGTAVLLAILDGGVEKRLLTLEEKIGPVACQVTPQQQQGHAEFVIPALPLETAAPPAAANLATALGLNAGDIGFGLYVPSGWSAGVDFAFVPLKSLAAVARAKVDNAQAAAFGVRGIFVFCSEVAEAGHDFHARMFAPAFGIVEDPATGSAAAAFAGLLARHAGLKDGDHAFVIEQGYEMGRPSLIELGLTLAGGRLTSATIGGRAVVVTEGTIEA
jgi:trans-2,3-dihydro-3-hydroxyanthranilate isomerase